MQLDDDRRRAAELLSPLRRCFASGRTRDLSWRLGQLRALAQLLRTERTKLLDALATDLGRNPTESYLAELYGLDTEVEVLRRGLPVWSKERHTKVPLPLQPARSLLRRDPLGTVLVVGPWNYPLNLVLVPLAASLAGGNCTVVKPSEHAPACSRLLAELLPRYLDDEATVVALGEAAFTEALIDEGVAHVFFTGSPAVGAKVAERAGRHLTPVTLELGGKSPVIVGQRADLRVAARRIAWGKFLNAGQSCIAPDYVLVERAVAPAFVGHLRTETERLWGSSPLSNPDYAKVVNDAHLTRLEQLLEGHGGSVVSGGEIDRTARRLAPTIVLEPTVESPLMNEEIFGPVLPVRTVDDVEAAIEFVRARPTPLALYVFTEDRSVADRVLDEVPSGGACINTTMHHFVSSELPFGGLGHSGTGQYHGRYGYERLTHLRAVLEKPTRPDLALAYPPYHRLGPSLTRRLLEWWGGH